MKAIVINGSPRKKWNTDKALQRAAQGFADAGGTVETVRLYDYEYKGCVSCFACKIKNSKTNGLFCKRFAKRTPLLSARPSTIVFRQDKRALFSNAGSSLSEPTSIKTANKSSFAIKSFRRGSFIR